GRHRLVEVLRQDDALARGEAVGLDDDGIVDHALEVFGLLLERVEAAEARRRDGVAAHEVLRERLAALYLRAVLAGPEDAHARGPQRVGESRDERVLRADDDEIDLLRLAELEQPRLIVRRERTVLGYLRRPGVSGRCEERLAERTLGDLPAEGVLAA